jgi:hypothetical protein
MTGQGAVPADGKRLPLSRIGDFGTSASAARKRIYLSAQVANGASNLAQAGAGRLGSRLTAAVAEHEREVISKRTKRLLRPPGRAESDMRVDRRAQAPQFAANGLPIIRDIPAAGRTNLNAMARQLTEARMAARRIEGANAPRRRATVRLLEDALSHPKSLSGHSDPDGGDQCRELRCTASNRISCYDVVSGSRPLAHRNPQGSSPARPSPSMD